LKIIVNLIIIFTAIAVLYRWRYQIVNMMMAVEFLREMAVRLSMNIPNLREKVLPGLFNNRSNVADNE